MILKVNTLVFVIGSMLIFSCEQSGNSHQEEVSSPVANENTDKGSDESKRAKYEPKEGILLFAGQELEALGGTEKYTDGYYDHFDAPAGFTLYTAFDSNQTTEKMGALDSVRNVGAGDHHMRYLLADEDYSNSILAIGLSMVGNDHRVASGQLDNQVLSLGTFIKSLKDRPVFLRIGYEFDAKWNKYNPEHYRTSFKRIRQIFDSIEVNNVAYIWQCTGWGNPKDSIMAFYPGDEVVDWCAFSYFCPPEGEKIGYEPMMEIARELKKPVFIAESTPMLDAAKDNKSSAPMDMSVPEQAERAWKEWFQPLFSFVEANHDVIKAIHYINCNWKSQSMWQIDTPFSQSDTRLQINDKLANNWRSVTSKSLYIKAHQNLFEDLK